LTIYNFYDIVNKMAYYYVPDQDTLTQAEQLFNASSIWAVGDMSVANAQLATAQNAYLATHDAQSHITCIKSLGQDAEGHNIWIGCNFLTESENSDTIYEFHTDTNPSFTRATGTTEGQTVYAQKQQDILNWIGLAQLTTLDALPQPRVPKVPTANT